MVVYRKWPRSFFTNFSDSIFSVDFSDSISTISILGTGDQFREVFIQEGLIVDDVIAKLP